VWKRRGSTVKDWVSQLFGFVQLGLGRVVAVLLEGLINGPEGISIRKQVRAILKNLDGFMGFAVGPSHLHPFSASVKGLRKARLNPFRHCKGVGLGLSRKSKRKTCLKHSCQVRLSASEINSLGASL
jgi:hypothetical protein